MSVFTRPESSSWAAWSGLRRFSPPSKHCKLFTINMVHIKKPACQIQLPLRLQFYLFLYTI